MLPGVEAAPGAKADLMGVEISGATPANAPAMSVVSMSVVGLMISSWAAAQNLYWIAKYAPSFGRLLYPRSESIWVEPVTTSPTFSF